MGNFPWLNGKLPEGKLLKTEMLGCWVGDAFVLFQPKSEAQLRAAHDSEGDSNRCTNSAKEFGSHATPEKHCTTYPLPQRLRKKCLLLFLLRLARSSPLLRKDKVGKWTLKPL